MFTYFAISISNKTTIKTLLDMLDFYKWRFVIWIQRIVVINSDEVMSPQPKIGCFLTSHVQIQYHGLEFSENESYN